MVSSLRNVEKGLNVFRGGWGPAFHDSHVIFKLEDLVEDLVVSLMSITSLRFQTACL